MLLSPGKAGDFPLFALETVPPATRALGVDDEFKVRSPPDIHLPVAAAAVEPAPRSRTENRVLPEAAPLVAPDPPALALLHPRPATRLLPAPAADTVRHPREVGARHGAKEARTRRSRHSTISK